MARPLAHLPAPAPEAFIDPDAKPRFAAAREASGRFARLLLHLASDMQVPADAAAHLEALRVAELDETVRLADLVRDLLVAWPELSEAAQPQIARAHRQDAVTASTEAAWDSLGKPIAVKQPDAFKVGDRIHITGRCAHFSELMPVHIVDRVTTAFGLPSLFVKREDGAPYAWHANKPIPIVEVMAGHCTRIGD